MSDETQSTPSIWIAMAVMLFIQLAASVVFAFLPTSSNAILMLLAFEIGLLSVMAISFMKKSKTAALFGGTLVLLVYFGLMLALQPLGFFYNLFAPLYSSHDLLLQLVQMGSGDNTILSALDYLWVLDLFFALFSFFFASIGVTWIIQVVTKKASVFALVFALVFFLIGIIILPYFWIATSGMVNFGANTANGALYFKDAAELLQQTNGTLTPEQETQLRELFNKASEYMKAAESQIRSLKQLAVFFVGAFVVNMVLQSMGITDIDANAVANLAIPAMTALTELLQGVGPLIIGVLGAKQGITMALQALGLSPDAFRALASSFSSSSSFPQQNTSSIDVDLFDQGISHMRAYFPDISEGLEYAKQALVEFNDVDLDQARSLLGNNTEVDQMFELKTILEETLDAFEELIQPYQSSAHPSVQAQEPLVFLLYAAFAIIQATSIISDNSYFVGVVQPLRYAETNLTIVSEFSEEEASKRALQLQINSSEEWQRSIPGMFRFLADMSKLAAIGTGLAADLAESFNALNSTMSLLQDNPLNLTIADYENARETLLPLTQSTRNMTLKLQNQYTPLLSTITQRVNNSEYGYLTDAVDEFLTVLSTFDLVDNIFTFDALANALYSLTWVLQYTAEATAQQVYISNNATRLSSALDQNNYTAAREAVTGLNHSTYLMQAALNKSIPWITNMNGNLSRISDSNPQIEVTTRALTNIGVTLPLIVKDTQNIMGNLTVISNEIDSGSPDTNVMNTAYNNISSTITRIETRMAYIDEQTSHVSVGDTSS